MGEREAPRTEGLAHSIDHPIDKSVDQSIQLKHPTRLVNSCKTYYYPFCIQKRSLVTHPCKTWIANLWFNFFLPTPTINFKSSRQLFFSDEHRIRKTSENTFAERREVVSLGAPRGTEIVAIRRYAKNITCFRLGSRRHCLMYISQGPDPIEHAWVRSFFFENRPVLGFSLSRLERIYTIFASLSMKNQNGITPLFFYVFFSLYVPYCTSFLCTVLSTRYMYALQLITRLGKRGRTMFVLSRKKYEHENRQAK